MITTSKFDSGGDGDAEVAVDMNTSAKLEVKREDKDDMGKLDLTVGTGTEVKPEELEKAIMDLSLKSEGRAARLELTSKLGTIRNLTADKKRCARRTAWIGETRKEVRERKAMQQVNLLEVLPLLAWEEIMDNLLPEEKGKLLIMTGLWRKLLEGERVLFLFQKIFPIIHQNCKPLSRQEILSCRGACTEWKKSIDHSLQNTFARVLASEVDIEGKPDIPTSDEMQILFRDDKPQAVRFLDWSDRTYAPDENPFIARKIGFVYKYPHPIILNSDRINMMGPLLNQWGSQIWDAVICHNRRFNLVDGYDELCKFLRLMPNLKMIRILGDKHVLDPGEFVDRQKLSKDFYVPLRKRMSENLLPSMPHLKNVGFVKLPTIMVKEALSKFGSTLETLHICDFNDWSNPMMYIGNTYLPLLKQFYMIAGNCATVESRFTENLPSLEELRLSFMNLEAADIPKLFRVLSGLGGSLQKLVLSLLKAGGPLAKLDGATMKTLSLKLPSVEEFSLNVNRINLKILDFILPMVALKELSVSYIKHVNFAKSNKSKPGKDQGTLVDAVEEPLDEIIQFGSYLTRLYESNIWDLFPELRKVTIIVGKWPKEKGLMVDDKEKIYKERVYTLEGLKQFKKERFQEPGNARDDDD